MVAAAIIGAGVAAAGAGVYGANKAANAQTKAGNAAISEQQNMFNTVRGDLAPYNTAGQAATTKMSSLLGLDGGDPASIEATLQSLPGYQFTQTQGLKAVQNSAAARGLGVSGAAQKGAANYATGLADSTYNSQFNNLLSASQLGENAAAQSGNYGTQTGANIGSTITGIGNAQAGGAVGSANAIAGGTSSISNAILLNKLLGGGTTGGGSGIYSASNLGAGATDI